MRRIRIPKHLAALLGAMLFVSCSNPEWVCGCSPAEAIAVVYGRVTDASGAGVGGAAVVGEQGGGACDSTPVASVGSVRTAADGRYRMVVGSPIQPQPEDCLRAYARPPQASALADLDTVPFTARFDYGGVVDSAAVDLVLCAP
jgi:hypothetical protein